MKSLLLFCCALFVSTATVANTQNPLLIGLNADMSAIAAVGGEAIKRGASIAIDEINAAGGVLGRPLALEVKDHRGNPARGLSNMKKFAKEDNLLGVLGGIHTPVVLHELKEVHQQKILYLIPWAAGTPIVDNGFKPNYVFRLSVRDEHAGHVLIEHAKKRGFSKVGLLLERTGWGRSNEKSMTAAAVNQNLTVSGIEWFNWRAESVAEQVDKLHQSGAEAILLVANAPEGATLVGDMLQREKDKQLPILSHWGISTGAFVKKAGLENILNLDINILQTYSFHSPENPEKMRSVLDAYRKKYDDKVTVENVIAPPGVVHAYDLVYLLAMAAEKAGSTDMSEVRSSMENLGSYQGLFKNFQQPFSENKHDALTTDDYTVTKYNENGYLVPVAL